MRSSAKSKVMAGKYISTVKSDTIVRPQYTDAAVVLDLGPYSQRILFLELTLFLEFFLELSFFLEKF